MESDVFSYDEMELYDGVQLQWNNAADTVRQILNSVLAIGDVVKLVTPLLAELNFRKRAGQIFTAEITDDVLGWLGLNRATRHCPAGEVEINPVVGVRHQGVERIVAECRGEKFHAYQPPTRSCGSEAKRSIDTRTFTNSC